MRILSLDGGGYLGLATAAFLSEMERHFRARIHDRFDLFCGTSTGAIIALALASGRAAGEIVDLYKDMGPKVFSPRRLHGGFFGSKYQTNHLRESLYSVFGETTLGDLSARGKRVIITAYSITSGKPWLFKTDHSDRLSRDSKYRIVDVALASAAAPVFFPLVSIKSPNNGSQEVFCDGGLVANHPALLGYTEAISELRVEPTDIQILSISAPRIDLAERGLPRLNRGLAHWREKLVLIPIAANVDTAHETLRRLVCACPVPGPLYQRVDLRNSDGLKLDDASPRATQILEQLGSREGTLTTIRERICPFFASEEV